MVRVRPKNRWFHTVVVMGASLSGCGGQSLYDAGGDDSEAGGSGGSSGSGPPGGAGGLTAGGTTATGGTAGSSAPLPSPDDCASDAEFVCTDYAALTGCRCHAGVPHSPADCPSPLAFRCDAFPPDPDLSSPPTRFVGCSCATQYPTPDTCPTPQIVCDETNLGLANCRCDPTRPTSMDQCRSGEYWSCQARNPDFGCRCECCIIR
jgi:hypothetical protein